jgi:hypothetical protein
MGLVALVAADSRVIRKYAKKKDNERRTRLHRFLPTSEIRKPVTQKSPWGETSPGSKPGKDVETVKSTAARLLIHSSTTAVKRRLPYAISIAQSQAKLEGASHASAASSAKAKLKD